MDRIQVLLPERVRQFTNNRAYLILTAVLAGCVFLSVILAIAVAVTHTNTPGGNSAIGPSSLKGGSDWIGGKFPGVCDDSSCLKTSSWMAENMDSGVDPCDNFYKFSCGGWIKKKAIPPDWRSYSVNDELWYKNDEKVYSILSERIRNNQPDSTERKVKRFFQKCYHDYGRMKDGGKVLIDIINNKFGGWYALNASDWNGTEWDMSSAMTSAISEYLIDVLFGINIYPAEAQNYITVMSGGMGMYSQNYHDEDKSHLQQAYKDYIHDTGRLLMRDANVTIDDDALEQFVADAYYQEYQMARGILDIQEIGDLYESAISTIYELRTNYSQIPWLNIIRGYFGESITEDTKVYVYSVPFFKMLNELLETEAENKSRILNNYLVWSFADTFDKHLSHEYRYAGYKYYKALTGRTERMPVWEHCVRTVENRLSLGIASLYVHRHVDNKTYTDISNLFSNIRVGFQDRLNTLNWMDNVTKERAIDKMARIKPMIGFPVNFFDRAYIDNLHMDLNINTSQSYFQNLLNTFTFYKKTVKMELQSGRDIWMWHFVLHRGAFGVKPRYFWTSNYLGIPAGSMVLPLYNKQNPLFLDYAALGTAMAYRLYSSVSGYGRNIWHNGTETNWWTDATSRNYSLAQECIKNYTSTITAGPYTINGENLTLPVQPYSAYWVYPNLAGIQVAYDTYKKQRMKLGMEKFPPGLNITSHQAFFVSFAQSYCTKRRDVDTYNSVESGRMPEEISVNVVMSQTKQFAEVFRCPADRKMNPEDKCDFF